MRRILVALLAVALVGCAPAKPAPTPDLQQQREFAQSLAALHHDLLAGLDAYNAWYNSPDREAAGPEALIARYHAEWQRLDTLRLRAEALPGCPACDPIRADYAASLGVMQRSLEQAIAYTVTGAPAYRTQANQNIDLWVLLRDRAMAALQQMLGTEAQSALAPHAAPSMPQ